MLPVSTPIPAAVTAEVLKLLQQAYDKLEPFDVSLTDKERRSLASGTMGTGSVAFAQEAGLLMASFPEVLRRTITDADIAAYPTLLETFSAATTLSAKLGAVDGVLRNITLAAGANVMDTARPAYADGQNDKGKTPGVHAIIERMSARFAQDDDGPTPPPEL